MRGSEAVMQDGNALPHLPRCYRPEAFGEKLMRAVAIALAVLTVAPIVRAQEPARAPAAPKQDGQATSSRPRVGYAGTPAPVVPVRVIQAPAYYTTQSGYVTSGAPYLVLTDGSVAVNFGNGYERVLRACSPARSPSATTTDQFGRDALGRIQDPPGIAALRPGVRGQVAGTMPAQNAAACFKPDGQGRPEIVTR